MRKINPQEHTPSPDAIDRIARRLEFLVDAISEAERWYLEINGLMSLPESLRIEKTGLMRDLAVETQRMIDDRSYITSETLIEEFETRCNTLLAKLAIRSTMQ